MSADANPGGKSPKSLLIFFVCAFVAAGLAFGGYKFYEKNSSGGSSAAATRDDVASYLKKKGHSSDFKTSMDFLKKDRRPWETLIKQYDSAVDYDAVYRLIGQHLWIADTLLKSSETRDQRAGEKLIEEVADISQDVAMDDWLTCAICDAYLVPIFKTDATFSDEDERLIYFVGRKYADSDQPDKKIDLERFYLSKAGSSRRADNVRYDLARSLQRRGDHEEAQKILAEMKSRSNTSTNATSAKRLEKIQKLTNNAAKN